MKRIIIAAAIAAALFVLYAPASIAQEDLTPPVLLDVTFEPQVIDTSNGPQTITATVTVSDDLSGLYYINLRFGKSDTTQDVSVNFNPGSQIGELVEGDMLHGTYINTMVIPEYSAYGEWEMQSVSTSDNAGNRISFHKPENGVAVSEDEWPSLFNGFEFIVESADAPTAPAQRLFIPLVN